VAGSSKYSVAAPFAGHMEHEIMDQFTIKKMVSARIPTEDGEFSLILYTNNGDEKEHLALVMGDLDGKSDVLVRIHSECFTGDVLGSSRCDCGEQLRLAMAMIAREGQGVLIYLRQEGRGIGLLDKLKAYNLQDEGYDTVDANIILGHQPDERDFTIAGRILTDLGIVSVRLLTNNPIKIETLERLGIRVRQRVRVKSTITPENARYLRTKVSRMNHLLNLSAISIELLDQDNGPN
jgi:3,4-dihydroxy 2-butanone 4-phosphate synthase/GTP cyclohydrolase II